MKQAELSTMEMRLDVLDLTVKMQAHRPKVVCFVGKKIWDVYESVVIKTARASSRSNIVKSEPQRVKLEVEAPSGEVQDVKLGLEEINEEIYPSPIVRSTPSPSPRRIKKPPAGPFNWHKPRSVRLPFQEGHGYIYFWVTPSTSGLERTPVRLFSRA